MRRPIVRNARNRLLAALMLLVGAVALAALDTYREARMDMLEAIRDSTAETVDYTGRSKLSRRVMTAMAEVPREEFVGEDMKARAYLNSALPITHGQTISQPFIVALMTDFLEPEPGDIVLEVGTGSGYQAAVLSGLVKHIYSIEIIAGLTESARAVRQHHPADRRRLPGLAGARPLRRHHRHRRGGQYSATAGGPTQAGRQDDDPGGEPRRLPGADPGGKRRERQHDRAVGAAGALCAPHGRSSGRLAGPERSGISRAAGPPPDWCAAPRMPRPGAAHRTAARTRVRRKTRKPPRR